MPVTGLKHQIDAYTIEASGTPVATIKATSVLDAMRFVLHGLPDLTGNGWWDGEEPLAIRNANWLEKDALLTETKEAHREAVRDDEHFVYWHSREATTLEDAAYNQHPIHKEFLARHYDRQKAA